MKTSKAAAPAAAFLLATLFTTTPPAFADSPAAPDPVQTALEAALSTSGGNASPRGGERRDGRDGIEDALKTALSAGNSKNGQPKSGAVVPPAEGELERFLAEKPSVKPGKPGKAVAPATLPLAAAPDAGGQMRLAATSPTPPVSQPQKPDNGISLKNNPLLWFTGGLVGFLCLRALISAATPTRNSEEPRRRRREGVPGEERSGGDGNWEEFFRDMAENLLESLPDGDGGFGGDISSVQQVRRTVPGGPTVLMP